MSLLFLALSEGDRIQTWWPCEWDQWRASLWLKEHFWRHPARLFRLREPIIKGTCIVVVRGAFHFYFFFSCFKQPMASHQQTNFSYIISHPALMVVSKYWVVKEVYIDMMKHISSWKCTVYWFWKVVLHKNNIRCVKRNMNACRWWDALSLSTFIHPWICDYSHDYTQSILQKLLQVHKMLNIYRLGKACTGCQGF